MAGVVALRAADGNLPEAQVVPDNVHPIGRGMRPENQPMKAYMREAVPEKGVIFREAAGGELEAQEGRLFRPLAYTKTFAMAAAAGLSVTLVPVLMGYFIRGRITPENRNPADRALVFLYRPLINLVLHSPRLALLAALLLAATEYRLDASCGRCQQAIDIAKGINPYSVTTARFELMARIAQGGPGNEVATLRAELTENRALFPPEDPFTQRAVEFLREPAR